MIMGKLPITKQPKVLKHVDISMRPGELLRQAVFNVGDVKGIGKVLLRTVIDTYSNYAFAFLQTRELQENAVAVLRDFVLPQFEEWGLKVSAIITDDSCGCIHRSFQAYLACKGIEMRLPDAQSFSEDIVSETFFRTATVQLLGQSLRENKKYPSLETVQQDLHAWLKHYNQEQPHSATGQVPPMEKVLQYLKNTNKQNSFNA